MMILFQYDANVVDVLLIVSVLFFIQIECRFARFTT